MQEEKEFSEIAYGLLGNEPEIEVLKNAFKSKVPLRNKIYIDITSMENRMKLVVNNSP